MLAAALFGRRGVFDVRWGAEGTQRLQHGLQCDGLGAGRSHAFFVGDLQLSHVVFPAVENFDLLVPREFFTDD